MVKNNLNIRDLEGQGYYTETDWLGNKVLKKVGSGFNSDDQLDGAIVEEY